MSAPTLHHGDCREVLRAYQDNFFDSSVDDAPYGLNALIDAKAMLTAWMAGEVYEPKGSGFMQRDWDKCVPGPDTWREVLRVLKPGAHLLVFGGSATVGLTEVALRLAGFEIRDQMQYLHGEGMPKGSTLDKTIDKKLGAERKVVGTRTLTGNAAQTTKEKGGTYGANTDARGVPAKVVPITEPAKEWEGWAPALKPAHEPIIVARKPLEKGLTLTQNVLKWGTGALNIDGCRIEADWENDPSKRGFGHGFNRPGDETGRAVPLAAKVKTAWEPPPLGRWPANVLCDDIAGALIDQQSGERPGMSGGGKHRADYEGGMFGAIDGNPAHARGDSGGASRFFYHPKPIRNEKDAGLEGLDWLPDGRNPHVTVKGIDLMRYLVRLVTRPGGRCLDSHMGSGTTGIACKLEGFEFHGSEWEELSFRVAGARIDWWSLQRVAELGYVAPAPKAKENPTQTELFA
ncbi:MAG TPA: DNA methyltransferase [Polyangiaceae bacterium]